MYKERKEEMRRRQKIRGKRDVVISLDPTFTSRPLARWLFDFFIVIFFLFFLFLSYSFSSSSSCSSYLSSSSFSSSLHPVSLSYDQRRERPLRSVLFWSLLFSQLSRLQSCRESRQLRRSQIRPSIGAKQAHPLKRYATNLSTHGERERFTPRQYWSNVKPV